MDELRSKIHLGIADYLSMMGRMDPTGFHEKILTKGSFYETVSTDWSGGFTPMKPKECFSNAVELALKNDFLYCEGIAVSSDLMFPIHHAWCVDTEGEVIDPTWRRPKEKIVRWFGKGLVFKPLKALDIMCENEYYGVLPYTRKGMKTLVRELESY